MQNTTQEEFWAGEFGDDYTDRNADMSVVPSNLALFSSVFRYTSNVQSVLELGANIGLNLIAIHSLLPKTRLTGIEINNKAYNRLITLPYVEAVNSSFINLELDDSFDFVFTKGVLIHQDPRMLQQIYELIYNYSNRYIFICEYYSPIPIEVKYRGHDFVLFKRDFAGEIMDKYQNIKLVKYGFVYHRDNTFPDGDVNWFLMEKCL